MTRKRYSAMQAVLVPAVVAIVCMCGTAAAPPAATAQRGVSTQVAKPFTRLPASLERQVEALGTRVRVAGKEQTIYAGELIDGAGARFQVQVVHQLPGLVRVQGLNGGRTTLAFDGERERGVATAVDDALLETFVTDVPEGLFASLESNAAMRVLGRRFGPDPRIQPNYKGPRYDIYEVTAPVASRSDGVVRMKLYYFDSDTGLLQSTRYEDRTRSRSRKVEIRFSAWGRVDGSLYPGRIDRYEDGRLVFSFVAAAVAAGPRLEPAGFR